MINDSRQVKLSNTELLRAAILEKEDTKVGLSGRTGLSVATCSTIIRSMLASGEVLPSDGLSSTGGRPAQVYRYNPHYAHILGLYVSNEAGINKIVCSTSTCTADTILKTSSSPTTLDYGAIEAALDELIRKDRLIKAVGIGVPGIVRDGRVASCDVGALQGLELKERIKKRFGVEAIVENDMNITAYGYYQKFSHLLDSLAVVVLPKGNGPGSGIIIGGKILRGHSGFAGEVHSLPDGYNALFQDPEDEGHFLAALARMLVTIIVMVNPQRILLTGELLNAGMIQPLSLICLGMMPSEHCPELLFQEDCSDEYLDGLRMKAHESLRYHYRLTSSL